MGRLLSSKAGWAMATLVLLSLFLAAPASAIQANRSVTLDSGNVGKYSSLELDGSGRPAVSYFDEANADLKIARCLNASCTLLQVSPLDTGDVGGDTSLALDSYGRPIVSYYFGNLDLQTGDLRVARCRNARCTGTPAGNIKVVDRTGFTGIGTSIVLDAAGNSVVSYVSIDDGLHVVHCQDPKCTVSVNAHIDPDAFGVSTSIALDGAGNPVVAYASFAGLRVAHCADPSCTSGTTIQTPGSTGSFGWQGGARLALDGAGNPVVSFFYWDPSGSSLQVLHCGDPTCSSGNTVSVPDGDVVPGGSSSLALDAAGNPVVTYVGAAVSGLRVLHCGDPDCSSGNIVNTPDPSSGVLQPSLVLDAAGWPVVSYYSSGDLRLLYCSSANCA